jgi:hypothetical protein
VKQFLPSAPASQFLVTDSKGHPAVGVDPNVPIEDVASTVSELVAEGKVRGDRTHHGARAGLRLLLSEWSLRRRRPWSCCSARPGGWPSVGIEYVAFAVNVVLLFAWGLFAGRAAGRTWDSALKIGMVDALLGLVVVVANAVSK